MAASELGVLVAATPFHHRYCTAMLITMVPSMGVKLLALALLAALCEGADQIADAWCPTSLLQQKIEVDNRPFRLHLREVEPAAQMAWTDREWAAASKDMSKQAALYAAEAETANGAGESEIAESIEEADAAYEDLLNTMDQATPTGPPDEDAEEATPPPSHQHQRPRLPATKVATPPKNRTSAAAHDHPKATTAVSPSPGPRVVYPGYPFAPGNGTLESSFGLPLGGESKPRQSATRSPLTTTLLPWWVVEEEHAAHDGVEASQYAPEATREDEQAALAGPDAASANGQASAAGAAGAQVATDPKVQEVLTKAAQLAAAAQQSAQLAAEDAQAAAGAERSAGAASAAAVAAARKAVTTLSPSAMATTRGVGLAAAFTASNAAQVAAEAATIASTAANGAAQIAAEGAKDAQEAILGARDAIKVASYAGDTAAVTAAQQVLKAAVNAVAASSQQAKLAAAAAEASNYVNRKAHYAQAATNKVVQGYAAARTTASPSAEFVPPATGTGTTPPSLSTIQLLKDAVRQAEQMLKYAKACKEARHELYASTSAESTGKQTHILNIIGNSTAAGEAATGQFLQDISWAQDVLQNIM